MSPDTFSSNFRRVIVYQQKCIEPVGESKSDYWIYSQLAERLGLGQEYTEGRTEEDWIKRMFDYSDLPKVISFEEFKTKGYYLVPFEENYKPTPALRWFYEERECDTPDYNNPKRGTAKAKELGTYSGKIEFVSESLKKNMTEGDERPLTPRYMPSWEGHESSEITCKYPLQMVSPHPRFSMHTHYDHTEWIWEIPIHRQLKDGYYYLTARVHPQDAVARDIREGDIIRLYNDRAQVLCIAHVTERVRPGVVHAYEASAKYDPLTPGDHHAVDKGGCVNLLTPDRFMSKNVPGFAPNSCLIEIARWEG
jgi:trimethylamine-N-oxide reductase (cytochrome c)